MNDVKINCDVPLTKNYNNANIKCLMSDEELFKYGFTNHYDPHMYFSKNLGHDIGFNIAVIRSNREVQIDILDENFCQPYDYQAMIDRGSTNKIVYEVHEKVQNIMKKLLDDGVIGGYNLGDYI